MESFHFSKRRDPVDWRSIAGVQINKIRHYTDVDTLQNLLPNVTYCDIESEDLRDCDRNIVKLFQLSQLMLEYVLYTQDHLLKTIGNLEGQILDIGVLQDSRDLEITRLREENFKRRRIIFSLQKILDAGAIDNHSCSYCGKVFIAPAYLLSHLERRHPEYAPFNIPLGKKTNSKEKEKAELMKMLDELQAELDKAKSQKRPTKDNHAFGDSRNLNLQFDYNAQQRATENLLRAQQQQHAEELQRLRDELARKAAREEEELAAKQRLTDLGSAKKRGSNLGLLLDDDSPDEHSQVEDEESDKRSASHGQDDNSTHHDYPAEFYRPLDPERPFILSKFPHSRDTMEKERVGAWQDASEELAEDGIPATISGLTPEQYAKFQQGRAQINRNTAQDIPNFVECQNAVTEELDEIVAHSYKPPPRPPVRQRSQSRARSASRGRSAVRMSRSLSPSRELRSRSGSTNVLNPAQRPRATSVSSLPRPERQVSQPKSTPMRSRSHQGLSAVGLASTGPRISVTDADEYSMITSQASDMSHE